MNTKRKRSNNARWSLEMPATVSELEDMGVSVLPNNNQENENTNNQISEHSYRSSSESSLGHRSPVNHSLQCVENVMVTPPDQKSTSFLKKRPRYQFGGEDYFDLLSDEVMLMIFQYIPKKYLVDCALVSQRWRNICYDESLWSRINLSNRRIASDYIAYVFQRNPVILRMAQCEILSPIFQEMAPLMEDFLCHVQLLDLSMAHVSNTDLAQLLSKCQKLKKLSLENCVTDSSVCSYIANSNCLEVLNMSQCYKVDAAGLEEILINCTELVELNLAWTGLNTECVDIVCKLVTPGIKLLNISGCVKSIKDSHVKELVSRCSCLVELDLSDCTDLTTECVDPIVTHLCDLKELSLSRCYSIVPTGYVKLDTLKSLQYLNVFGLFVEKQLVQLQSLLPKIQLNKHKFSTIARPTVGIRRTSIWEQRVYDYSA